MFIEVCKLHVRTFFYLEQLILKHGAAATAVRIKQMDHGIDFYSSKRSHGNNFLEFIGKVAPIRSRNDKQLVSHDSKSSDSQDQRSYCNSLISNNLDRIKGALITTNFKVGFSCFVKTL